MRIYCESCDKVVETHIKEVYLVGPSYKWDDDIKVFLSPESALRFYRENDHYPDYHLSRDKSTILNHKNMDTFYIKRSQIMGG